MKQNLSLQWDLCNSWTTFPFLWTTFSPLYCREQKNQLCCIRQSSSSLSSFSPLFSCALARVRGNIILPRPGWNGHHNPVFARGSVTNHEVPGQDHACGHVQAGLWAFLTTESLAMAYHPAQGSLAQQLSPAKLHCSDASHPWDCTSSGTALHEWMLGSELGLIPDSRGGIRYWWIAISSSK